MCFYDERRLPGVEPKKSHNNNKCGYRALTMRVALDDGSVRRRVRMTRLRSGRLGWPPSELPRRCKATVGEPLHISGRRSEKPSFKDVLR